MPELPSDAFKILSQIRWGLNPRTRQDRSYAFIYKHEDWLNVLPQPAAATLKAIAAQFAQGGTDELESKELLQTPAVRKAGGLPALKAAGPPAALVSEAKARMFAA